MPAGSIRINERLTLQESDAHGNQCITRMIHFTENLRRLRLDTVEYAALKVIILMSSGTGIVKSDKRFVLDILLSRC
jgi:nuclear receptor subfamily 5 group A protein 3